MGAPAEPPSGEFSQAFERHRSDLLRHCYRMLGSFADAEDLVQDVLLRAWRSRDTYAGDAPLVHWLMRIATNTCLKQLARRKGRQLPQLDHPPVPAGTPFVETEASQWVTPAPDDKLFETPARATEVREDVAIAFIALLQRLPPRQRAALLLKDVLGWPAEEIAATLELTLSSVNSALHRARETVARPAELAEDPPPAVLRDYLRSWETHDVEGLVALLKKDVVLAMPPHSQWFRGAEEVRRFFEPRRFLGFWAPQPLRANGLPASAWYKKDASGTYRLHALHVMRFEGGLLAEATHFIGAHHLKGFDLPQQLAPPL